MPQPRAPPKMPSDGSGLLPRHALALLELAGRAARLSMATAPRGYPAWPPLGDSEYLQIIAAIVGQT